MTVGLLWTAGDLTWTLWLDNVANPPAPSFADALYLTMYPAVYVAMMLLSLAPAAAGAAQWLDGGVVGLAVAAVGAALVSRSCWPRASGRFLGSRRPRLSGRRLRAAAVRRRGVRARPAGGRDAPVAAARGGPRRSRRSPTSSTSTRAPRAPTSPVACSTRCGRLSMRLFALAAWQPARRRQPSTTVRRTRSLLTLPGRGRRSGPARPRRLSPR